MSDSNYPSPFGYPAYAPSNEIPENEPIYGWMAPFSHPSFTHHGPSDINTTLPGAASNTAHPVFHDRLLNSKVAIPRSANPNVVTNRGRVSRACESCRDQKVKCSGHRPTCQRCEEAGMQCSYGDRKREKMARVIRRLDDLTSRAQLLETVLQNIYPNLDSQSAQYVEQVLAEPNAEGDQSSNKPVLAPLFYPDSGFLLGSFDFTNEDFNRDGKIQTMGFVGQHSEIAWIHRLKQVLDRSNQETETGRNSLTAVNFFLDDSKLVIVEDIDLFERPPLAISDRLVDNYFHVVHQSFPIIGKITFLGQYKSFYSSTVRPRKQWLAILNLIFAISAKHCLSMSWDVQVTADDPLIYFSRAWRLSMQDDALLDHPNLQQVQVEGLLSFYFMCIGQANRSWRLSGISLLSAVTMGLNLRNEGSNISQSSRETRYRVWWSLYLLHTSVCVMTGRPLSNTEESFTTPLPVPFLEEDFLENDIEGLIADHEARGIFMQSLSSKPSENFAESKPESPKEQPSSSGRNRDQVASAALQCLKPNASLHFLYLVELGFVGQRSINTLYAPGVARKSWHHITLTISALNSRTDMWLSLLPAEFHFSGGSESFERERLCLAFQFYSTKILITQPCLDRLIRQGPVDEQPESFCATTAAICVELAGQMLELLPDDPDASWIYRASPWWCIVHYIMQSATVLLLSLFLKEKAGTIRHQRVLEWVSKAVDWLAVIATKDPSAQRAWQLCRDLISRNEFGVVLSPRKAG